MKFNEFCNYMKRLQEYKRIQQNIEYYPKAFDLKYRELLEYAKKEFVDQNNNIERWLDGRPCVFDYPRSRKQVEYMIGNDYEALYYFLVFCKRVNNHKRVSEDYVEHLTFLILRSNHPEWEEC